MGCGAGLRQQNERIIQLEEQNRQLLAQNRELRLQVEAQTEQNALLREQVAALQAENQELRGRQAEPAVAEGMPGLKTPAVPRAPKPRKRRAAEHNHGRQRMAVVDERVRQVVETCPHCGTALQGGWVQRRVQLIELPPPRPVVVTEHELLARTCPECGRRVTAASPGLEAGRIGRCRFGSRLLTAVALMATVERLPQHLIQQRLARDYGLRLSEGGVVGLLQRVAERAQPVMATLQAEARASPVVHMDETGWRENGCNGYLWLVHTPTLALLTRDPHRSMDVPDRLLGEDFGGTLVTDFYAAYDVRPVLPKRPPNWMAVGKALPGSPTMTTIHSTEVQSLPLMVNGGTARPRG